MLEITSRQRKLLEKQAIDIQPVVIVGQNGVTPSLTEMVSKSLYSHELIKIKFNEFKDDKSSLTEKLCNDCDANLIRIIGNVVILFKQNADPEKRIYKL